MGGINHQPCNGNKRFLACSTLMSRNVSRAHVELEEANVALEDILLGELDGESGSLEPFLRRLAFSRASLRDGLGSIESLRQELQKQNYSDLPTLYSLDLVSIGIEMVDEALVEPDAWKWAVKTMKSGGFCSILDEFEDKMWYLIDLTYRLEKSAGENLVATERGELNLVLEENRPGNFKVDFAVLYTAWGMFHRMFLASSMLSTELWYAYTLNGSLLSDTQESQVA